tara:strand:+ start:1682 stop:2299 length:618 start_codon:yes stop_codon:yes gene_type:complete
LYKLVREELDAVLSEQQCLHEAARPLTHAQRLARAHPHQANVQRSQARAAERKRKEEEERKRKEAEVDEGCEGNANHSLSTGAFVNPDDEAGSYSIRDKSCKRAAQRKRPNASKYSTAIPVAKKPCGRGSKWRCGAGTAKWEEQLITDDEESVSGPDKAYIAGLIQQEFQRYTKHKPDGCTVDYCAKLVNGIIAASKGEMFDQGK